MNTERILAASPWIEVLVRNLYWRSSFVHDFLEQRKGGASGAIPGSSSPGLNQLQFEKICEQLGALGVSTGGVMIVHSSGSALRPTGLTAQELCQGLYDFISPGGTLAMPAIPYFREESKGPDRLSDAICERTQTYDVKRTPPWTGALPKALLKFDGAVRSRHPLNSMVAIGPLASRMMALNIDGDRPMACGPGSSWKFCADQNAYIVCLGVDTAHSLTMIHVAEDSWAESWPIKNWYRDRKFHIVDADFETDIVVRERKPNWAMYYGERTLQKDLIHSGVLKVATLDGLRIEVCRAGELINFLNSRNKTGYPYWIPFWAK